MNGQLTWSLVGNTAGFGQVADGRPFWVGDFNGTGGTDILLDYPGRPKLVAGLHSERAAYLEPGRQPAGFGQVADGPPFWVGDFTGTGGTEVLFNYPGDGNWWLGSLPGTSQLYQGRQHGRFRPGRRWRAPLLGRRLQRHRRDGILFYYLGDHNWWLGPSRANGSAYRVGNTAGFGHLADGRPLWVGDFALGQQEVLLNYLGDGNWWLGSLREPAQLTGGRQPAGFGHLADGRPFLGRRLHGLRKTELLFNYPGDGNWWLGAFPGNRQLTKVGNTAGFGQSPTAPLLGRILQRCVPGRYSVQLSWRRELVARNLLAAS